MIFSNAAILFELFPGLQANEASRDASTVVVNECLNEAAQELNITLGLNGYPTSNLNQIQATVLECANSLLGWQKYFLRRMIEDQSYSKFLKSQDPFLKLPLALIADRRKYMQLVFDGTLSQVTVPEINGESVLDLALFGGYCGNWNPQAASPLPTILTVQRWLNWAVAIVNALAAYKGYPLTSLTAEQADYYRTIIFNFGAAILTQGLAQRQKGELDAIANERAAAAVQLVQNFASLSYDPRFI
jgi:hypothetical protein